MSPCPYCGAHDVCKPNCSYFDEPAPVCDQCGEVVPELHDACQDHFDEDLCPDCYDSACEAAWERQQEGLMSEPPMSARERHLVDWRQKQELRR